MKQESFLRLSVPEEPPSEAAGDAPPSTGPQHIVRSSSALFPLDRADEGRRAGSRAVAAGEQAAATARWRWSRSPRFFGAVALGAALLVIAFVAGWRIKAERAVGLPAPPAGGAATLVIETQPAGWHVWDGEVDRGVTPLALTLPPGRRTLALRRGTVTRQLQVDLVAGGRAVHHLELPAAPPIGDLHIRTIPPGAIVAVDGIGRGVTPLDVRDLKAGRHVVTLLSGDRVISQEVTVEPGALGSLIVPLAEAGAPAVGWLTVESAVDLEILEGESLVGSSRNARLLFMPGRHALRMQNRELGVEIDRVVEVRPGGTSKVLVALPKGTVSLNAAPWADVFMDGVRIGETPIADHEASLGPHEVVFRHPTLGEQRRTIVVSLTAPVRLGVDLRQ